MVKGSEADIPLRRAVVTGIDMLADLTDLPSEVTSGDLEQLLRVAAERHASHRGTGHSAVVQVRVACAHLGAGEFDDAHRALIAAWDLMR